MFFYVKKHKISALNLVFILTKNVTTYYTENIILFFYSVTYPQFSPVFIL